MSFPWLLLGACLIAELVARVVLEIRERRLTGVRGGVFTVLRLIPLVNDIVPLPECRREPVENEFVRMHEEGHATMRHSVLRNLVKVAFLLLAVWAFAFLLSSMTLSILEAVLWLHLAVIPFRMVYHWYCWYQEYDADRYAFEKLGKKPAKAAMRNLVDSETPYTKLFALVYREHPTARDRSQRILNK
jgi:hypothetical protein